MVSSNFPPSSHLLTWSNQTDILPSPKLLPLFHVDDCTQKSQLLQQFTPLVISLTLKSLGTAPEVKPLKDTISLAAPSPTFSLHSCTLSAL